jgi:hypothetical protein
MIAELSERGMTKWEAYSTLKPLVLAQTEPMIFRANPAKGETGGRVPKDIPTQLTELKNEIGRVWVEIGKASDKSFDSQEIPKDEIPSDSEEPKEEPEEPKEETKEEPKKEPDSDRCYTRSTHDEFRYFLRRMKEIRRFCINRKKELKSTLDSISMRPSQEAKKLLLAGVPADLLLLVMTMHWSPDIRIEAGIDGFDFNAEGHLETHPEFLRVSRWVMQKRGITEIVRSDTGESETPHELFGYVLLLAESRIPTMLIGPAGTGKSHLAAQMADYLEMDYAETPMSTGASRGDLLGRHTISQETPFITSEFQGMYGGNGGVFNFEEIDRCDPGVVITLHNSLAGKKLFNSVNGQVIVKSVDFWAVSTANTFGQGASKEFSSEKLDAATLDRFRMGRCFLPIDEALEERLFFLGL